MKLSIKPVVPGKRFSTKAELQPGDVLNLDDTGGMLVYYTPEEAAPMRELQRLRQVQVQRIIKHVEERVRKEK